MRVVHITPDYYPAMGGGESYVQQISERLAARGHEVSVLAMNSRGIRSRDGSALPAMDVVNGVRVTRFNRTYAWHDRLLRVRGAYRVLRLLDERLAPMLTTSPFSMGAFLLTLLARADVVGVANWYHSSLAYQTCIARRLQRFRLVGIPLTHIERPWAHTPVFSQMLARCDAVVAMTDHEKRFIETRSGRRNAYVVGAGIDPAQFAVRDGARMRQALGVSPDTPVVGFVGRMSATKGVVTLVRAMQAVWVHTPNARLLLAGSGLPSSGRCDPEVRAALDGLSDAERSRLVCIPSFSEADKASIFDALDVFAMASTAESFGIAYLEAWMCGKPVIGSAIGSTACVIRDHVDGRLVPVDDPGALAACISELLADGVNRDRMGREGRARALASFTWERITDSVEDVYATPAPVRQPVAAG